MIFDIKKRLKTGWKFSKLFGLREAFFRRGFTTADLKIDGKVPVSSLVLCAQSTDIVEKTNEREIRPEEQNEKAENYQENLWNEMQLKRP